MSELLDALGLLNIYYPQQFALVQREKNMYFVCNNANTYFSKDFNTIRFLGTVETKRVSFIFLPDVRDYASRNKTIKILGHG